VGALLIEAIQPGVTLQDASRYPSMNSVAELISSLHSYGSSVTEFPPLTQFITYLFDSWLRQRELHPELVELVPEDLFERGRRFAARLATQPSPTVPLHGDLTPVNVFEGGDSRGLVAIDPAPCLGDPAYDTIDLLVWQVRDITTIEGRAAALATAAGLDPTRLLDWCVAFAGMFALDLAGRPPAGDTHGVDLTTSRFMFDAPICKADLPADPDFADALIIRMPPTANPIKLTAAQWSAIERRLPRASRATGVGRDTGCPGGSRDLFEQHHHQVLGCGPWLRCRGQPGYRSA
jgi:hypothetical protein